MSKVPEVSKKLSIEFAVKKGAELLVHQFGAKHPKLEEFEWQINGSQLSVTLKYFENDDALLLFPKYKTVIFDSAGDIKAVKIRGID